MGLLPVIFTNNFEKKMSLLVALFMDLLTTGGGGGGDGQTCYTWYRWLLKVVQRYQINGNMS